MAGDNPHMSVDDNGYCRVRTPKTDSNDKSFIASTLSQNGYVPILQVLKEVNRVSDFINCFKHLSPKHHKMKSTEEILMAGILGKQKQLNRVEQANKFSHAVFFYNDQTFQEGSHDEQEMINACKLLLQNAIILWNYLYLSQLVVNTTNKEERLALINVIRGGSVITFGQIIFSAALRSRRHSWALPYLLAVTLLALLAANTSHAAVPARSPVVSSARTYVFVCDNRSIYTVRATGTEAWIFRPEGSLRLPAVPTETGAKYASEVFEIWILGEQARLGEPTGEQQSCHNDRRQAVWEHAKLNGADFRAVGNEPGWNLVIMAASRIVLVSAYGASRIEVPLPEPMVDSEARTTRWDAGELVLEVSDRPCRDSMSGEAFESTVVVTTKTETLHGCGRALH